MMYTSNLKL